MDITKYVKDPGVYSMVTCGIVAGNGVRTQAYEVMKQPYFLWHKEITSIPGEEWEDLFVFYNIKSEKTLPAYMTERLEHDQRIA